MPRTVQSLAMTTLPGPLVYATWLAEHLDAGDLRRYANGETVFTSGDATDETYVIKSGIVEICRRDPDSGAIKVVAYLGEGDSIGEMAFYYAAADVAVIGGSFVPLGGQNLIEACAAGTPAIFGPSMFNFAEASALALESGAALQARDAEDAVRLANALLAEATRRQAMAQAGLSLCAAHRGATQKHVAVAKAVLAER